MEFLTRVLWRIFCHELLSEPWRGPGAEAFERHASQGAPLPDPVVPDLVEIHAAWVLVHASQPGLPRQLIRPNVEFWIPGLLHLRLAVLSRLELSDIETACQQHLTRPTYWHRVSGSSLPAISALNQGTCAQDHHLGQAPDPVRVAKPASLQPVS